MSIEIPTDFATEALFKPIPAARETIASITNRTARSIIKAEAAAVADKTIRLRNARLEFEKTIILPASKTRKR